MSRHLEWLDAGEVGVGVEHECGVDSETALIIGDGDGVAITGEFADVVNLLRRALDAVQEQWPADPE